ncbi:MAG: hypothetical protein LBO67_06035 [Spirochaetaceae bacterium]|nr:hypothetical protein [Spirochaetaceae bacterium]
MTQEQGIITEQNLECGAIVYPSCTKIQKKLSEQRRIAALIKESFSLRRKSERLLSDAKEMVEREIECG